MPNDFAMLRPTPEPWTYNDARLGWLEVRIALRDLVEALRAPGADAIIPLEEAERLLKQQEEAEMGYMSTPIGLIPVEAGDPVRSTPCC